MKIKVERYGYGFDSTGGLLRVENVHIGYTCEDQRRPTGIKVQDETCIPAGRYEIKLRNSGGMNRRYKKRFVDHRGMLHLQDVPGFEWIYIHIGNNDDHTSGCILVGRTATRAPNGEYTVGRSVEAYTELYAICSAAIESGEKVFVEVL